MKETDNRVFSIKIENFLRMMLLMSFMMLAPVSIYALDTDADGINDAI